MCQLLGVVLLGMPALGVGVGAALGAVWSELPTRSGWFANINIIMLLTLWSVGLDLGMSAAWGVAARYAGSGCDSRHCSVMVGLRSLVGLLGLVGLVSSARSTLAARSIWPRICVWQS